MTRFVQRLSSFLPTFRCYSTQLAHDIPLKQRVRKFVLENPNLSAPSSKGLDVPASPEMTRLQRDLLQELELADVDFKGAKIRQIRPNSKENPLLVGSMLERKVDFCLCYPDVHYMRSIVLYRDLPARCQCGHWFKLIDMERYEQEREKRWTEIKNEPENVDLFKTLVEVEDRLNTLFEASNKGSQSVTETNAIIEESAALWKKYTATYAQLRRNMDLP